MPLAVVSFAWISVDIGRVDARIMPAFESLLISKSEGTGTRYVFTALHRNEADLQANKTSGWLEGTNIASISSWSWCSR
jgi:hypothetical protein